MDALVWNQVRNSLDVHACLVSTVKLTIRSHPQGLQGDGEALHVWELLWTEGVWLPVRGAWLGFLTLSRDPTSLPVTAVKVFPGFQERVVSSTPGTYSTTDSHSDEEPHRGTGPTPSWMLTSLSRVSTHLTHPIERDQEHPIPKTALLDLWTALTLQNPFFWENKTPVYYLLTALVLFLKILKKKWNPFSWWNIKQNSGLQSQLSCLTLVAFPPLASQFRRRDCLGCMQLPQPGPLCLGTLWPAWKYPTCWSFMKNNSSQVSNMSVVLPILMEEVFSLIQMTHSTFPLSRPIHLVGDNTSQFHILC